MADHGPIGYGLMGLTSRHSTTHVPEEQAFEAMRTAIELGCTVWNGGTFYGRGILNDPFFQLISP
ncbi:hypothetical protein BT63DRAFT_428726 [Microthyrium microscopicum]|uniref:NADP-dependent oxidoreductase domain-containing protein n=1 Tax=Microthyrium microscopicum TaxID=703497 RepID=A0A6A6U499_9PEZI|nr:hypothetical protein BT63DRAFT_428726 [Microthyrium microscopicum]